MEVIHEQDRANLARMIGQLTPDLVKEAELRTQLYHRAGNTGAMGVAACVEMVRFVGLGQVDEIRNEPLETYDFRTIQLNTELWVKQEDTGSYRKAVYVGPHPNGKIAVKYAGYKDVYGVKPCNCLLHEPPVARDPVVVDSPVDEIEVEVHTPKGKRKQEAAVA
jgi:hypothetical protein